MSSQGSHLPLNKQEPGAKSESQLVTKAFLSQLKLSGPESKPSTMSEWVIVSPDGAEEPVEIPTEQDGSLLLCSVTAQFPGTTGLKYRHPETNKWRGVRIQGEAMLAPNEEGWGPHTYYCVRPLGPSEPLKKDESRLKRKTESDVEMYSKNLKVEEEDQPDDTCDLIILGLPWKTREEEIREYFEQYGKVNMVTLKTQESGKSKGFGFIKFADKEVEKKVILQRHMIDGRWCDIKYPDSQLQKGMNEKTSGKIFVGRVTETMTKDDLREHFSSFGDVTDVYIPKPFRHFAFVQFSESKVAQSLLRKEHNIKGVTVKIGEASPKGIGGVGVGGKGGGHMVGGGGGGGGRGGGQMGGGGRYNGFDNPYGNYNSKQFTNPSFNTGSMFSMSGSSQFNLSGYQGGINYGASSSRDHRRF